MHKTLQKTQKKHSRKRTLNKPLFIYKKAPLLGLFCMGSNPHSHERVYGVYLEHIHLVARFIMRIQIITVVFLFVCLIGGFVPKAHANDASAVVSRMDIIIKQMEALKAEFALLVAQANPTTPSGAVLGASTKAVFTQSLENGETNEDIKRIQKLLATDPEIYPYGVASGFYGPKTEEGIKNFQTRFDLDPVGVVGPATKALLELFFRAYPDEDFPANALAKKPQVLGASTSVPPTPTTPVVTTPSVPTTGIEEITAKYDGDEARVTIAYKNDTTTSFLIEGESKIEVVDAVAVKLGKTRADILALIEFTSGSSKDDDDEDEDDEDFNIDIEIDDDEVSLSFEYDGDDYEVEVDSTDEDDVLDEVADEMGEDLEDIDEDLIEAIEDALDEALDDYEDEGSDEIESITAHIADGEAHIEVEYGNGDDEDFTVEEDYEDSIIEEVADELNIDEDEVEDLIEFEYEDVDEINVEIEDGKAIAFVEFEDGTEKRIKIDSDDEDEIIEAIAEELDEDEDDVEEWVRFDYLD
jgi:peptidoglycan hydrolase-like protein with peptidoglycan-binding domain